MHPACKQKRQSMRIESGKMVFSFIFFFSSLHLNTKTSAALLSPELVNRLAPCPENAASPIPSAPYFLRSLHFHPVCQSLLRALQMMITVVKKKKRKKKRERERDEVIGGGEGGGREVVSSDESCFNFSFP